MEKTTSQKWPHSSARPTGRTPLRFHPPAQRVFGVSPARSNRVRPKKTKFPICFRASRRQNTYRRTGILPVSIFVFKFRNLHPHADEGGLTPFAVKRIRVNSWNSCQNGPHSCPFVPIRARWCWRVMTTRFSREKPVPKPINWN